MTTTEYTSFGDRTIKYVKTYDKDNKLIISCVTEYDNRLDVKVYERYVNNLAHVYLITKYDENGKMIEARDQYGNNITTEVLNKNKKNS